MTRTWLSVVLLAAALPRAIPAATPDVSDGPAAWTAPPYWVPPVSVEEPRGRGDRTSTAGRQPLAVGPTALPFVALFPCRLVDTRAPAFPAPLGGGFLPEATVRNYTLTGVCNLPASAKAISLNATVTNPTASGFLVLWPKGGAFPPVSTLNFLAGQTIVNAAVVPLSTDGGISVALGGSGGDVILDTNGYYADVPSVTSLNTQTGDVTLAAGTNVTITPSGSTLTIASTASGGPPTGPAGGSLSGTYPNPGIAANAVGAGQIAAGAVGATQLATGAVGMSQLAAGAVTDAKVASVSWGKVTGAPGFVLKAGDTMTGSLNLNPGNINLVTQPSTATSGSILKNGSRFIHDYGSGNTFVGLNAGNFTMTGAFNTASGEGALSSNSTGSYNTASGYNTLNSNTTGSANTAVGVGALISNTTGSSNTASGYDALYWNTTGYDNTVSGYDALHANTTGYQNTASGRGALYNNTTGYANTAKGYGALASNTTAVQNTAVGYFSLYGNATGFQNTALGDNAGNRSGAGIGYGGGAVTWVPLTTGSYNTFVGRGTGVTAAGISNCTAIGIDAYCDGSNQVRLGNIFVGSIGGNVGWSALSDARAKRDIRDLALGLDFVLSLRPVSYTLRLGNGRTDMGFLAQDVEALLGRGYNVVAAGGDPDRTLSLRYTDLIAPLVKAIQEQQALLQAQQAMHREQLEARDARIAQMERRLAVLEEASKSSSTVGSSRGPESASR